MQFAINCWPRGRRSVPQPAEPWAVSSGNSSRAVWIRFSSAIAALAFYGCSLPSQATLFNIKDLGYLPGGESGSSAYGINTSAQIVGQSSVSVIGNDGQEFIDIHACYWDEAHEILDLGTAAGIYSGHSSASGINASGQVVGEAAFEVGTRAFLWDSVNGMQSLGVLSSDADGLLVYSRAVGLNDKGQVVGQSTDGRITRAFLWDTANGMQDLGELSGNFRVYRATAINSSGYVIGSYGPDFGTNAGAFLWDSVSGMQDLGGMSGGVIRTARAINSSGQIVGQGRIADGRLVAYLWDVINGIQVLPLLPGGDFMAPQGINSSGQVIGLGNSSEGSEVFLWDRQEGMQNLGEMLDESGIGWKLLNVRSINDLGQIVGTAVNPSGQHRAFLLTPVPEPETLVLIATAFMASCAMPRQLCNAES